MVKGGHLAGGSVVDVLAWKGRARVFRSRRLPRGPGQRGTGCRFASALATELGAGTRPEQAVSAARAVVRRMLRG